MANKPYSVPSRLCGHEVKVHQYADYLEVYYKDHLVERLSGRGESGRPASTTGTSSGPWCVNPGPSPGTGSRSTSSRPRSSG